MHFSYTAGYIHRLMLGPDLSDPITCAPHVSTPGQVWRTLVTSLDLHQSGYTQYILIHTLVLSTGTEHSFNALLISNLVSLPIWRLFYQ